MSFCASCAQRFRRLKIMDSLTYTQLLRRNLSFRRLWIGQVISELGNWFNFIAALGLVRVVSHAAPEVTTLGDDCDGPRARCSRARVSARSRSGRSVDRLRVHGGALVLRHVLRSS